MFAALHRHAKLTVVFPLGVRDGSLGWEVVLPLDVRLIHQGALERSTRLDLLGSSLKPQRDWICPFEGVLLDRNLSLAIIGQFLRPNLLCLELIERRSVQMLLILRCLLQPKGVGGLIALLALVLLLIVLIPSGMVEECFGVLGVPTVAVNSGVVLLVRVHANKTIKINKASCRYLPT